MRRRSSVWPAFRLIAIRRASSDMYWQETRHGIGRQGLVMLHRRSPCCRLPTPNVRGTRPSLCRESFHRTTECPIASPGDVLTHESNIRLPNIEDGNPAAVGIRFNPTTHCSWPTWTPYRQGWRRARCRQLKRRDMHFMSVNMELYAKASPGWQFTRRVGDVRGAKKAAIKEHEAGPNTIRAQISKTPTAALSDPGYCGGDMAERIRLRGHQRPAVIVSN